jgi:hypothetical protein
VAKDLFVDLWERTSEVFGGHQEIDSKILKRRIKYYVIPRKDGVPIISLHDDEWEILKDRKLHKRVVGEIINKITEEL